MSTHLDGNLYCNVATVSADGYPWNTPLFFVHQTNVLYWWSPLKATHSQNILDNGKASITVYDSRTPVGKGGGACLYLDCKAELVGDDEAAMVIQLFNDKVGVKVFYLSVANTTGDAPTRLFKATIGKSWVNADTEEDGYFIDVRKEAV
jgi:hypothetical protein